MGLARNAKAAPPFGWRQLDPKPPEAARLHAPVPAGEPADPIEAQGLEPTTGGRTLAGAMFTPAGATPRLRRQQARAAQGIERAARRAETDAQRTAIEADKAERRSARYLPAGGEAGPAALRCYRRLRVQPHRATSEVLASAYPFLAEAGLGSDGIFVGHDAWSGAGFCFDPWVLYDQGVLTNPNALLAGVIGRGKSTLAKALATRSIAFGRRVYVPGDAKGE
jgi:hypothetical protein